MAAIKSCTDLPQSKKLAEILPIESADMMYSPPMLTHFENYGDADNEQELPNYMVIIVRRNIIDSSEFDEPIPIRKGDFPCWSLAALLNLLPNCTDIVKEEADTENEKYMCTVGVKDDIICTFGNNPVDACVAMIEKLNELNLL